MGASAIPALVALLDAQRADLRRVAAQALGCLARDAEPATAGLARLLGDGDLEVRQRAVWALGKIGAPAVTALAGALADAEPSVRLTAARSLAAIGERAASTEDAVRRALGDADARVRLHAASALSTFGGDARAAVPILADALTSPEASCARTGHTGAGTNRPRLARSSDGDAQGAARRRRRGPPGRARLRQEGAPRQAELSWVAVSHAPARREYPGATTRGTRFCSWRRAATRQLGEPGRSAIRDAARARVPIRVSAGSGRRGTRRVPGDTRGRYTATPFDPGRPTPRHSAYARGVALRRAHRRVPSATGPESRVTTSANRAAFQAPALVSAGSFQDPAPSMSAVPAPCAVARLAESLASTGRTRRSFRRGRSVCSSGRWGPRSARERLVRVSR